MPDYKVMLGKPIRFLALRWDAGWEFDAPTVLLEPVCRYGFGSPESIIEDAAIDMCVDDPVPVRRGFHPSELEEFAWRRWTAAGLKKRAMRCLAGWKGGARGYRAEEAWFEFSRDDRGGLQFKEVSPAEGN